MGLFDFLSSDAFNKTADLVGGIMDYRSGREATSAFQNAANNPIMDPFGSQRGFYQQQLQNYYGPNFDVNQVPGYAQASQEATRQAERSMAARGYNFAPGALAGEISRAVAPLAMDASQEYNRMLAQLAGGNLAPNAGAFNDMQTRAIEQQMNRFSPIMDGLSLAGNIGKAGKFLQDPSGFFSNMFGGGGNPAGLDQAGAQNFFNGGTGGNLDLSGMSGVNPNFSLNAVNQLGGGGALNLGGLGAGAFGIANSLGPSTLGFAGASGFLPGGVGVGGALGSGGLSLAGMTPGIAGAGAGGAGAAGAGLGAFSGIGAALPFLGIAGLGLMAMGRESTQDKVGKIAGNIFSETAKGLNTSTYNPVNIPGVGTRNLRITDVPAVRATHGMNQAFEDDTGNLWLQSGKGASQGSPLISFSRAQLDEQVRQGKINAKQERAANRGGTR